MTTLKVSITIKEKFHTYNAKLLILHSNVLLKDFKIVSYILKD